MWVVKYWDLQLLHYFPSCAYVREKTQPIDPSRIEKLGNIVIVIVIVRCEISGAE
jgi:hypothetical protein